MEDVRSAPFIRPLLWQQRWGLLGGHALAGVQGKAIGIDRSGDSRNAEGVNLRAAEEGGAGFASEKGKEPSRSVQKAPDHSLHTSPSLSPRAATWQH